MFCPECGLVAEPGPLDVRSSLHQEANASSEPRKSLFARLFAPQPAQHDKARTQGAAPSGP